MPLILKSDYHDRLPGLYEDARPVAVDAPALLAFNDELAEGLGLDLAGHDEGELAMLFSGQALPEGARPIAQGYAGHQFGSFTPQLGDGRALLLGEVETPGGALRDIQLKGSGRTAWSRGGDGLAAIGPVLREYMVAEAMHALGVPTTRALAAVSTGLPVYRDQGPLPGAMLTRVADSHIRIGTFQFYALHGEQEKLARLFDYTLARHYPGAAEADDPRVAMLDAYADRLAELVAWWMSLGFVHGVMNTDNMALSGETIDYGPCAFMDRFDPATCFSSIDRQGRYAYANQPPIAQWNLARLAEALLTMGLSQGERPSEADMQPFIDIVQNFGQRHEDALARRMAAKLGLETPVADVIRALFTAMEGQNVDYTAFFRALSDDVRGYPEKARVYFDDEAVFDGWAGQWRAALSAEGRDPDAVAAAMDRANPLYIPRNHKVEEALAAAQGGDYALWERMLAIVTDPYVEQPGAEDYASPAPDEFGRYVTFCGT